MRPFGPWQRLALGGTAALILWVVGIIGYMIIEGFSFLDAAYQTITAVTTAGFGEINPLGDAGRVFTIAIIIVGIVVILYILTAVMQLAVEGELETLLGVRRMKGRIEGLRDHYILCGFGRVGEEIAREFTERRIPFVVADDNPEALERCRRHGYLLVEGATSSDAVLLEAGIQRARCLLAASDSDSGNTYIVLSAKALNPNVFVVVRVGQPVSEERVRRAGADRVISPYTIGGRRMALSALQPLVVDFMDTLSAGRHGEQVLAEIEVTEESGLAAMTIEDCFRACPGATVIALQKPTGTIQVGPRGATILELNDRLMVLGEQAELERVGKQPATADTEEPVQERI
jgi:voltage-gated potassium channel